MSAGTKNTARSPYTGVVQILLFNWPWYGLALAGCVAAVLYVSVIRPSSVMAASAILAAAVLAAFWSLVSLGVSHFVYDRSKIADGRWIEDAISSSPRRIASFHAGLDETWARLSDRFPSARLAIFDFYDPETMTEPSIRRARRIQLPGPSIPIDFRKIPLEEGTQDAVFVVFAAHELRRSSDRLLFFREIRRVVRSDGDLVVVEHLRDAWNLLAFGPGAFHFVPRGRWLREFAGAGFDVRSVVRVTPFVSVFGLRPDGERPPRP